MTNVYDLRRKRLLWSGEDRTLATLEAFFDLLGPERTAALEGICCDMWQPYIDVVKARAPQAVLVFDKFHIVRHLMAAVDQVRRDEIREKGPATPSSSRSAGTEIRAISTDILDFRERVLAIDGHKARPTECDSDPGHGSARLLG